MSCLCGMNATIDDEILTYIIILYKYESANKRIEYIIIVLYYVYTTDDRDEPIYILLYSLL